MTPAFSDYAAYHDVAHRRAPSLGRNFLTRNAGANTKTPSHVLSTALAPTILTDTGASIRRTSQLPNGLRIQTYRGNASSRLLQCCLGMDLVILRPANPCCTRA
jgi:hypothetical protein